MEALKILRKHLEGQYLFSHEVSSEDLVEFQKSIVNAMEEYANLNPYNEVSWKEFDEHPKDNKEIIVKFPNGTSQVYIWNYNFYVADYRKAIQQRLSMEIYI